MQIIYTDKLSNYMREKAKENIIVEIAKSDSSDFEVTEFHTHFISDKQADLFISRQGFHKFEAPVGNLLLPNYRLVYEPTVTFDLKKVLFFNIIKITGINF